MTTERFEPTPFRPHPVLGNQHVQTIWGTFFPRATRHAAWEASAEAVSFDLPDGDRLHAIQHVHPDDPGRTRPMLVLMHGLEGNQDSHYVRGMSLKAYQQGFHSIRLNYRGCAGPQTDARRLYNGHLIEDIDFVLRRLGEQAAWPLVPVGVSLGANKLLRLLSTYGEAPPPGLMGAVAISPPIDFLQTNVAFKQGFNRLYDKFFLFKLKGKHRERLRIFRDDPAIVARSELGLTAEWLEFYDELVTAPEGGFANAHDYYVRASVGDGLAAIRVPTLILHAEDDPIIPMAMFLERAAMIAANPALTVIYTPGGGHVGFMEPAHAQQPETWMDAFWAENQAVAYTRWLFARREPTTARLAD
ncbi:MAG: putative hydrolase of the alpha/beta-hydrolase fold family [Cyanobacteria bacterium RYN_339]|nr:putative hydrolase of the alpha/beta-hydrolase fold family [Cyanobacteria bacterium RYN_339]